VIGPSSDSLCVEERNRDLYGSNGRIKPASAYCETREL